MKTFAVPALDLMTMLTFVFIVLTALAFQAEMDATRGLPAVALARSPAGGPVAGGRVVAVSARRDGAAVRYFVDADEVPWSQLGERLRALAPGRVLIRIDEELPAKHVIQLMGLLDTLKVTGVSLAVRGG